MRDGLAIGLLMDERNAEEPPMRSGQHCGATLVELLVVIAVVSILAALLLTVTGGVREKARQVTCISHLRQLGQAVAMYRQDYGGTDSPAPPGQMGFPPSPLQLVRTRRKNGKPYLAAADVLSCPSFRADLMPPGALYHYLWKVWDRGDTVTRGYPDFATVVRERGSDYPLMADQNHNPLADRPGVPMFVLVLRLDGRVSSRYVPSLTQLPAWQW
jgi:type II secretory pathway pseudopilin PulG